MKGHLAVLLGLLSKDSDSLENIMNLLPGDSRSTKLQSWIDAVAEFASFYSDLTTRFAEAIQASRLDMSEEDDDLIDERNSSPITNSKSNNAVYSANSLLRIQEPQGEMKGIKVAHSVLQTLEQLQMIPS